MRDVIGHACLCFTSSDACVGYRIASDANAVGGICSPCIDNVVPVNRCHRIRRSTRWLHKICGTSRVAVDIGICKVRTLWTKCAIGIQHTAGNRETVSAVVARFNAEVGDACEHGSGGTGK